MDDLISRQAAIDAIKGRFSMPVDNLIVEVIGNMPSAQQEIIRCKDCLAYGEMMHGKDERMICHKFALNFPEDFYCAEAERREDG